MIVILEIHGYSTTLGNNLRYEMVTMDPRAAAHTASQVNDCMATISAIVQMPEGFGAAMRDFNNFCIDPEPSR